MLERLTCNACGAPLEAPDTAKFIRCNHCQAQLRVRHSDASYTETLERLEQKTNDLADEVRKLSKRSEMEALERCWEERKEQFYITDEHGRRHLPTRASSILGAAVIASFGMIWIALHIIAQSRIGFGQLLFGLLFVAVAIAISFYGRKRVDAYEQAMLQYQMERAAILAKDD